MAEWRSGARLPICMVLTLISISRRIDSDDSIGVKLLLYSICVVVYTSIVKLEVTRLVVWWRRGCGCLFNEKKSMKKARKKLKVKRVEDTIARPLCGCIYTAPDLSSKSGA